MFALSNFINMEKEKKKEYRKRNVLIKRNQLIKDFCKDKEPGKQLAEAIDKMALKYDLTADSIYKIIKSK